MSVNVRQIITDSLLELGVLAPDQDIPAELLAFGVRKLNRLFDRWAARAIMAYNVSFNLSLTTSAAKTKYTIGPGGDLNVTQRPVMIPAISYNLAGSGTAVYLPLAPFDDDDWAAQTIPDLQSTVPTNYYYSPDFPLGTLYLWPVVQAAHNLRIEMWGLLPNGSTANSNLDLPPGYWDAVINNLALQMAPSLGPAAVVTAQLIENARAGLRAIQGNNATTPKIQTQQAGMPTPQPGAVRPDYNFLTGKPW